MTGVRTFAQQKAGLTRAVNRYHKAARAQVGVTHSDDPTVAALREQVVEECRRTVAEWESEEWAARYKVRQGAWPDDWARWARALGDVFPWNVAVPQLEDL